jgi:methyl-accepting chemotaxis protein
MKNRRRQYFVKDGDHRGLLFGSLVLILSLIVIVSGLFYIMANRSLEGATYRAHFQTLRNTMQLLLPYLVLVNLVGLIVVIALAVFLTHRVSGPAYHLTKDLQRMGEGDLTVATAFRKKDRFQGMGEAMAAASSQLRKNVADIKGGFKNIENAAENHPEMKESIEKVKLMLDKLKT